MPMLDDNEAIEEEIKYLLRCVSSKKHKYFIIIRISFPIFFFKYSYFSFFSYPFLNIHVLLHRIKSITWFQGNIACLVPNKIK